MDVVFGKDAAGNRTCEVGQRLAKLVVEVAGRVRIPLIVADRCHTIDFDPACGDEGEVQFETHVACVYTGHIHIVAVTGVFAYFDVARTSGGLVHPLGVIGVEGGREYGRAEAVAQFGGEYFLVDGVGVGGIGCCLAQEYAGGEEGSAADVSDVAVYIVVAVKVVVDTELGRSAQEVVCGGFGVFLVIVEVVDALVSGVAQRSGEDDVHATVQQGVFALCIYAFLVGASFVVAVYNITDTEFFVTPVGVGGSGVVFYLDILTAGVVHVVFAVIEVYDFVVVEAYIVAHVDTGCEAQFIVKEAVVVCRDKSVPVVRVVGLRHYHIRTGGGCAVHQLDFVVSEGSVFVAEEGIGHTVGCAIPRGIAQRSAVVCSAALAGVSAAGSDGYICGSRQRGLVVNLPDVGQRNLGLVVGVAVGAAYLSVKAEAVSGIVLVGAVAVHDALGVGLIFHDGKAVLA